MTSPTPGIWYGVLAALFWMMTLYTAVAESGRPGTYGGVEFVLMTAAIILTGMSIWMFGRWKGQRGVSTGILLIIAVAIVLYSIMEVTIM